MKQLLILSLLGLSLTLCSSCRNNRLKANEKKLVKEILSTEKEKVSIEKVALEKKMSENGYKSSGSFRVIESRSVDAQKLPILIDIVGTRNNSKDFKLSDFASSIKYVKLQTPPDTSLLYDPLFSRNDLTSIVRSDGEQIILQGIFGLTRFNMQGEYQETIWKNERGIKIEKQGYMVDGRNFYGVLHLNPVSILNGNIYYSFSDGLSSGQFMKYKPETIKNISVQTQTEVPGPGSVKGDTLLSTQKDIQKRFNWIYGVDTETWVGINDKWNAGKSGSLLVTYNNKGETLCQFSDFDRIVNYDQTTYRGSVGYYANYYYDGLLTIKQAYNDTVFRLIPPNRLLPTFIIDFGEFKVNYMEGLNPKFDLSGKYILYSLFETNDFLFIRYTQNYDCTNNRNKKSVKFYNVLFNKKQKRLYHQPGFTLLPEGIINDLDGGISFWPDFITPQGEMIKLVSGENMKDYVRSAKFTNAAISEEMRQKQISLAAGLRSTDMILIIVK